MQRDDHGFHVMSPGPRGAGEVPAGADYGRWLHDLRNAVNTASVASAVVRRMLDAGMTDGAREMLPELEHACARCSALLSGDVAEAAAFERPIR